MPPSLVAAVLLIASCVSLTGVTEHLLFSQASSLKYWITVLVPIFGAVIARTKRYDLALLAIAIIVAPFNYVISFPPLSITPLTFMLALALACSTFGPGSSLRSRPTVIRTMTVFLVLALAGPLLRSNQRVNMMILIASGLAMGYLVALAAREAKGRRVVIVSFVASCTIQSALGIWEFLTGNSLNFYSASGASQYGANYFFQYEGVFRVSAAFPGPIAMGNVLAMAVPMLIVCAVTSRGVLRVALTSAAALVIGLGTVSTLSRSSWLAALAADGVMVLLLSARRTVGALVGAVVVTATSVLVSMAYAGPALMSRWQTIFGHSVATPGITFGDIQRQVVQGDALSLFRSHILTGIGLGNLAPYLGASAIRGGQNAQNNLYQLMAEAGVFALAAALLLLGSIVWTAIRSIDRNRTMAAMILAEVAVIVVVSSTDSNFRYTQVTVFVAVVFGLASSLGRARDEGPPATRRTDRSLEGTSLTPAT